MKLRVRSLESRETLKIQAPDPCSVQHFNLLLSLAITSSSSSSPSSIHLSLNRKDELQASSPLDSLQSLGVTSADLIYYTFNPTAFSRRTRPPLITETLENQVAPILSQTAVPNSGDEETLIPLQALGSNSEETLPMTKPVMEEAPIPSETLVSNSERKETLVDSQALVPSAQANPNLLETKEYGSLVSDSEKNEAQEFSVTTGMDIDGGGGVAAAAAADDDDDDDDDGPIVVKRSFSEPCFLRKVLREEFDDDGTEHKLLVIAVHAVMLESGFVGFDSVSGMRVDRFHLPDEWPSMSLWYTLPELLDYGSDDSPAIQSVVLKFQRLGRFIYVHGTFSSKRSTAHLVILDDNRFAPTLYLMWAHSDSAEEKYSGSNDSYPENEVFEFWKIVKDGLALPLLIDICEKGGLLPPPCLMRLPVELKLRILELLPVVDLVNVGCVCSELRYLSSNNDLWKLKFIEEFGNVDMGQCYSLWKDRFVSWSEMRKKRNSVSSTICRWFPNLDAPSYFPVIIGDPPNPFDMPPPIGGDYDWIPGLGIPSPFGQPALPSPFGQPALPTPFGQPALPSPFGQPALPSPFGQPALPSPFGQPARRYRPIIQRNTIPRCNLGGFMG